MKTLSLALVIGCSLVMSGTVTMAQGVLSQSTDSVTITPGNSISCNTGAAGAPQFHVNNGYTRSYEMAAEGITAPIQLSCVNFGVENATAGPAVANPGFQPVEIRLYLDTTPNGYPVATAGLTLVHTEMFEVPDTVGATSYLWNQGISASPPIVVQPSQSLVVEIFTPDGTGAMNNIFLGSNAAGQSAPCYLEAAGCGTAVPTDLALLGAGFPNIQFIIDVEYVTPGALINPTLNISQPGGAGTGVVISNGGLLPNEEIWNFYSFTFCPTGTGTGPILGTCISAAELTMQLATPLGVEPLHYLSPGCTFNSAPLMLPVGLGFDLITVKFDSTTGILGGFSAPQFYQVQ